jgi:hypothetical protein
LISGTIYHNGDIVELPDKYVGKTFLEAIEAPKPIMIPRPEILKKPLEPLEPLETTERGEPEPKKKGRFARRS